MLNHRLVLIIGLLFFFSLSSASETTLVSPNNQAEKTNSSSVSKQLLPAIADSSKSQHADSSTSMSKPDTLVLPPNSYVGGTDSLILQAYLTQNYAPPPKRSPSTTMLKSVLFPGWGQYANKKYVKAGIIFTIESYFIYRAVDYGIKAKDSRKVWKSLPDSETDAKAEAFRIYTDDRDNRNSNIWYSVVVTFFSMIDAYVDAHLRDFPKPIREEDALSVQFAPDKKHIFVFVYRF